MTIREFAKIKNFKIVGKLTRRADWEQDKGERWYMDEAGNEYYKGQNGFSIITADGGII